MTLVSCNDLLDKNPLDQQTNNPEFWNIESNVQAQVNKFYESFHGYGPTDGQFYFKSLSDDQVHGETFQNWKFINVPAVSDEWNNNYTEVRRANTIIEGVEASTLSDAKKAHYTGIARMMRAYHYFKLVRAFGNVTYTDKVLDLTDEDVLYGERTDRDVVMDKVLDDLNFAVTNIDDVASKISFSRSMAQALKADICLWEGTFRKYRTATENGKGADMDGAKKFLNACVDACNAVMGKGYKLNDSYHNNYISENLAGNPEMITYKSYVKDYYMHSLIDYTASSTEIYGMTKDAFDSYLFKDGKPLALTREDVTLAAVPNEDGDMSISKLLAIRDKRLSATTDSIIYYTHHEWKRAGSMQMHSSTGYGVAKYDNITFPTTYRTVSYKSYNDAPVFWLAVVYCNYAEAKAELGTITQEDLNSTINKLMARAELPDLNLNVGFHDPANDMGVSDLLWEIRRCRRCELMFDNDFRYWDLIRWHQLDKLDTAKNPDIQLGADIKNEPDAAIFAEHTKGSTFYDASQGGQIRKFEAKHYLYPIPSGQISLNPKLGQNPGW